jgi:hypothetical protein
MTKVVSLDFQTLSCNCNHQASEGYKYNNVCCRSLVVYKAECNNTGKVYIGNTQQHLKQGMGQHARDLKMKMLHSQNSDSFASHFADQMSGDELRSPMAAGDAEQDGTV